MPPRVPEEILQPFEDYLNGLKQLHDLNEITVAGITVLQAMPGVVNTLIKVDASRVFQKTGAKDSLEDAHRLAELARLEVGRGFALLYEHSIIYLWNSLKSVVREFVTRWITFEQTAKKKTS